MSFQRPNHLASGVELELGVALRSIRSKADFVIVKDARLV